MNWTYTLERLAAPLDDASPVPLARGLPHSLARTELVQLLGPPAFKALPCPLAFKAAVEEHLAGLDSLVCLSLKSVRRAVELQLGFPEDGLRSMSGEVKAIAIACALVRPRMPPAAVAVGAAGRRAVHLGDVD